MHILRGKSFIHIFLHNKLYHFKTTLHWFSYKNNDTNVSYHLTIYHYDESPGIKVANVIYPVCPGVWAGGINVLNLHCSFFIDSTCLPMESEVSSVDDGVKSKDVSVRYWIEWERWRTSCVLSITKQPDLFNASTVFWTCSIQGENVHNLPPIKIHKTHDNNKLNYLYLVPHVSFMKAVLKVIIQQIHTVVLKRQRTIIAVLEQKQRTVQIHHFYSTETDIKTSGICK